MPELYPFLRHRGEPPFNVVHEVAELLVLAQPSWPPLPSQTRWPVAGSSDHCDSRCEPLRPTPVGLVPRVQPLSRGRRPRAGPSSRKHRPARRSGFPEQRGAGTQGVESSRFSGDWSKRDVRSSGRRRSRGPGRSSGCRRSEEDDGLGDVVGGGGALQGGEGHGRRDHVLMVGQPAGLHRAGAMALTRTSGANALARLFVKRDDRPLARRVSDRAARIPRSRRRRRC